MRRFVFLLAVLLVEAIVQQVHVYYYYLLSIYYSKEEVNRNKITIFRMVPRPK
jgi:hypothetical protein